MKKTLSLFLALLTLVSAFTFANISAYAKPSKPTKVVAYINSNSSVTIKWKKVSGAKKYEVYKKIGSGKYKKAKTVSGTSATIKKLSGSKKYYFKLRAVSSRGSKSSFTSPLNLKTSWGKIRSLSKDYYDIYTDNGVYDGISFYFDKPSGAKGYVVDSKIWIKGGVYDSQLKIDSTDSSFYLYDKHLPDIIKIRAYKKDSNNHTIYGPRATIVSEDEMLYSCEDFYSIESFEETMIDYGYTPV